MEEQLKDIFVEIMHDTCRDQMIEPKVYNSADAGEKMRQCFSKFYKLIKHQNDYYNSLTASEINNMLNA